MTVEEVRGGLGVENEDKDNFPVGMRVLAVDDDPTCLKLLESLLRKCQYHVATTSQARMALKMLRENKSRFDLVISDVHMPDMDGFKLLELVGLEMDLPVIMLSGNSDTKLVMKGITHGACDYLVKPVRLEELRNIWQHVIRRKKFDTKCQSKSASEDKAPQGSSDGGQGLEGTGNSDQNGKLSRKRKDEEEEGDDNGDENEDPATQKKPRVVWSIELHRKFVAAVNQLGIEKAVPKRILDLMNVEGLTRENVASHLQKYRLYLKRISSVATQQASVVGALGNKDASFMRLGPLDGLGDFRKLAGTGRLTNTALSQYGTGGMLGRLNSPAGLSLRSLNSSTLIRSSQAQNLSNSINTLAKFQPFIAQANQNTGLFQGIPSSLELDQLNQSKGTTNIGDFNPLDDPRMVSGASTFADTRVAVGSSGNSVNCAPNNHLLLQGNPQTTHSALGFGNQSSLKAEPLSLESYNIRAQSSSFMDHGRCNENWQNAIQSSQIPTNSLPSGECLNPDLLFLNGTRDDNSSNNHHFQNGPLEFTSNISGSTSLEDTTRGMQCQGGLVGNFVQNKNQTPIQRWGEQKQDYTHNSNNIFSTTNSLLPANGITTPSVEQNSAICNRKMNASVLNRLNGGASTLMQLHDFGKSKLDSKMGSGEDYLLQQTKSQSSFVPNGYDSLDDLMNTMMKWDQDGMILTDGEFGFDADSFGSSI